MSGWWCLRIEKKVWRSSESSSLSRNAPSSAECSPAGGATHAGHPRRCKRSAAMQRCMHSCRRAKLRSHACAPPEANSDSGARLAAPFGGLYPPPVLCRLVSSDCTGVLAAMLKTRSVSQLLSDRHRCVPAAMLYYTQASRSGRPLNPICEGTEGLDPFTTRGASTVRQSITAAGIGCPICMAVIAACAPKNTGEMLMRQCEGISGELQLESLGLGQGRFADLGLKTASFCSIKLGGEAPKLICRSGEGAADTGSGHAGSRDIPYSWHPCCTCSVCRAAA